MERPGGEPSERQPFASPGNIVNTEKSLVGSLVFQQSVGAFPTRNGLTLQLPNLPPVRSSLRGIVAVFFVLRLSAHAQDPSPSPVPDNDRVIIEDSYTPNAETEGALRVTEFAAELRTK